MDDDDAVRRTFQLMLEHQGHEVATAGGGQEALGLFQKGGFELVIADLDMPGMKGDELAAAIRAIAPAQPIILATARSGNAQGTPALLQGCSKVRRSLK